MAEMLLINPRKRRATRKAKMTRTAKRRVVARKKNPIAAVRRRRANPMAKRRMIRRNPIGGMGGDYMTAIREALMGGAGALAMDVAFGQINKFLPATLRTSATTVGAGDAVKAVLTVFIGQALNKATRGFSKRAAQASLTVQAHAVMVKTIGPMISGSLPLGYASPAMITQGTNRIGPIRKGVNAYTGGTPLLSAYNKPGSTPLLSGGGSRRREGVSVY
jgi:hypothetical protein